MAAYLSISDLRKRFGEIEAVRGISFQVERGECFGLLWPACALVHDPPLLLLDEPTVGVDPQSRNHK